LSQGNTLPCSHHRSAILARMASDSSSGWTLRRVQHVHAVKNLTDMFSEWTSINWILRRLLVLCLYLGRRRMILRVSRGNFMRDVDQRLRSLYSIRTRMEVMSIVRLRIRRRLIRMLLTGWKNYGIRKLLLICGEFYPMLLRYVDVQPGKLRKSKYDSLL